MNINKLVYKGDFFMIIYVVESGDTLFRIGQRYGLTADEIAAANELPNSNELVIGQAIVLPLSSVPHTVVAGDTMYQIARQYGVTLNSLIAANPQITNPARLNIGTIINVPMGLQNLGSMEVNGYAIPGISEETLIKTLPALTYITTFSYNANEMGNLSTLNDEYILEKARQAGVQPFMAVTNYREGEGFSSDVARAIFASEDATNNLIAEIIRVARDKGFEGVNMDFEYIYPADRDNYSNFLRKLKAALVPFNLPLFVAVAPKTSADQQGTLYEAHDYAAIGEIADRVIIMTYEWGYLYGSPQAISPIKPVIEVLQYAVTEMPSEKILMGVSNYAYDWQLPFVSGTAAEIMSNTMAVERAKRVGANIMFDEETQSPFYTYYDANGNQHIVWFDDARSYAARMVLVDKLNLAGVSYWTINQFTPSMLLVQQALFDVVKA